MKLIFAGSGEFGLPTLEALLSAGHDVVQVVSQPDRPAGRGRVLTPTPIAKLAIERSLPLLRTADINRETLADADLMIVIAFGQKIAEHQVHHPRLGSINLHGSRLPKYRGAAPIHAAIVGGETVTGNSIIRVAPRMDAGAVLAQSSLPIGELETAGELHDRLAADGAPLMLDLLKRFAAGTVVETPQDDSKATLARKLSRQSAKIEWTASADTVARQIRGLYPWPGCHAQVLGTTGEALSRVTLVRARPAEGSGAPATVLADGHVATGSGAVEIVELQPEGKRPMSLAAFRNGHHWVAGMRLESV
jgi:methionyl-tRNA formyltransferase